MLLPTSLKDKLSEREQNALLRCLRVPASNLTDFTSNDYLGIAKHSLHHRILNQNLGATGSRLLTGNSPAHESLEKEIADFHLADHAILYSSGYMANLGLLSCVAQPSDRILYDMHIHASMLDGIRLSKASAFPFQHNNFKHLEKRLQRDHAGNTFVCTESIFSMQGSITDLETLAGLCKKYHAYLIVDEAHSVGVTGPQGSGTVNECRLQNDVFATIYTYGKAFGAMGAAITGSKDLIHYLTNYSRPFIYSTAPSPIQIASIKQAYELVAHASSLRKKLWSLAHLNRSGGR